MGSFSKAKAYPRYSKIPFHLLPPKPPQITPQVLFFTFMTWKFPLLEMIPGQPCWSSSSSLASWAGLGGSPLVWPRTNYCGETQESIVIPLLDESAPRALGRWGRQGRPHRHAKRVISQGPERTSTWFKALLMLS